MRNIFSYTSRKRNILNIVGGVLIALALLLFLASIASGLSPKETSEIDPITFTLFLLFICIVIGIVAVLSGLGGGVIFTPLMIGFTPIDSYIVRGTGLVIAMAGALVAARPFLRRGLANIRLLFFAAVPYTLFAALGAVLAAYVKETMGVFGEALIRLMLGLLVLIISAIFLFGGKKVEYPEVKSVDSFTEKLELAMSYWEESLNKVVDYKVTRAHVAIPCLCGVGLISGLFGLGAGWAMIPVFNLIMLAPLKVAAACSKVLIGIGDTAAVWPYIMGGAIIPAFVVPCLVGLVVGTIIGAKIMLRVKAGLVRYLIIALMVIAGIRLIIQGFEMLRIV